MADTKVCTENRIAFQDVKGVVLLNDYPFVNVAIVEYKYPSWSGDSS